MKRPWRLRHLMASWVAWWLGLGAVSLGSAIPALWRLNRAAPDSTGEVTAGMTNLQLGTKIVLDGAELPSLN